MGRILAATLIGLTALPVTAQGDPPRQPGDDGPNIHFTLTLVDTTGSGATAERTIEALALSGRGARLSTGWKVAVPAGRSGSPSDAVDSTVYQYQDLGMSASLEGRHLDGDRVRVSGRVEISALGGGQTPSVSATAGLPQIGVFTHSFEATLASRTPTTLAEAPKPDGGAVRLILTVVLER